MERLQGFPPVVGPGATTLILGSMPGPRSLELKQYYGHPHNAFWGILGELVGASPQLPYPERLRALKAARIALWDVIASCVRDGSLDTRICNEEPNDFETFFAQNPGIRRVFFNGSKAEQTFRRMVLGRQRLPPLHLVRLPSTSPANAQVSYAQKLAAWRAIVSEPARASWPPETK